MHPPCEEMNRSVLPEIRKRLSHKLNSRGLKQQEIAESLGITQAMVSKYLKAEKRGFYGALENFVGDASDKLAEMMLRGMSGAELLSFFCDECFRMREKGVLCGIHAVENCRLCMNIRGKEEAGERAAIIEDVEKAVSMIEKGIHPGLIPEVRVNIASGIGGAESEMDIVAIPGRMVEINGKLRALTSPEFGASRHLSELLLKAMRNSGAVGAVINVFYSENIGKAMEKAGLKSSSIENGYEDGLDALVDKGAFGREPCVYVFGKSALDAAKKVIRISDVLRGTAGSS